MATQRDTPHASTAEELTILTLDVGMFLWTAGLTTFLMGISWGGVIYPWNSPGPISSIVIGFVLLVVLFIYESKMSLEYPAIPVKLFFNRGFISLVCCATIASVRVERLCPHSGSSLIEST